MYPCNSGFRGVHGEPTLTTEKERHAGLSVCISSTKARLNVLSYAEVEYNCDIEVIPKIGFRMHMGNGSLDFIKRNKLYVVDMSAWRSTNTVLMRTDEREHMYTRREKRKALEAKHIIKDTRYPTETESVSMIWNGIIKGTPYTVTDVKAFYDIYEPPLPYLRGRMTSIKSKSRLDVDEGMREQRKH